MSNSHGRRILAIAGLLILGGAAALSAQATDNITITRVPFEFSVGTTSLPRDTYRVSRMTGHNDAVMIRSLRHGTVVLSQPGSPKATNEKPRLVFNRYGDRYFLREIWLGDNVGYRLPKTRLEREASEQVAALSVPEVVVVHSGR
jgi:hypothetical protein